MRSQRERSPSFFLNKTLPVSCTLVLVCALLALGGCDGASEEPAESHRSFTGMVTSFEARSILEFESITVADESGVVLDFHAGGRQTVRGVHPRSRQRAHAPRRPRSR